MSDDKKYDIFLSYNSLDHAYVERVAKELKARKCSSFIDRWYLTPGHDWVEALERALQASRSVAVFLGPHEMGRWQQRERAWALDRAAEDGDEKFPVIPVLLPGSEPPKGFLKQRMWIDLRDDHWTKVQLDALAATILGQEVDLEGRPNPKAMICPYRGLMGFREEDADFFFGRDAYLAELVDLIQRETFVGVVGASGCGKSSLVSAGLIPKLRDHNSGLVWEIVRLVPHVDPLYSLAQALAPLIEPDLGGFDLEEKLGEVANDLEQNKPKTPLWGLVNAVLRQQQGTQRLLLFVDQWEELYTNCESAKRRERFIQELLEATARRDSPLSVVLTVRGDFYNEILRDRPLLDRVQSAELKLGPMNAVEMRSVIEGPGKNIGLTFQDGLVDRILRDAGEETGRLALLEFALEELWKRREGVRLTHAGYEDLGRQAGQKSKAADNEKGSPLSRAIATYAESVYRELAVAEKNVLPGLFRKLVRAGAKAEEDTRRRITLNELDDLNRGVVRKLADKRLLITKGPDLAEIEPMTEIEGDQLTPGEEQTISSTVEVAHEELLRRWGRLKEWITEDREFLQWRSRIELKINERQRDGDVALFRGRPLQEAKKFFPARTSDLENNQNRFLQDSLKAERRRKLSRWGSLCLVVFIFAAIWTFVEYGRRANEAERLVENLLSGRPGTAEFYLEPLAIPSYRNIAIRKLAKAYENEEGKRDPFTLRRAVYGLIHLDSEHPDQIDFLLDSVTAMPKAEGPDLVDALRKVHVQTPMADELGQRLAQASSAQVRNQCLALQLSLGIEGDAVSVCKLHAPTRRTEFILGFEEFPGDLEDIARTLETTSEAELRSALCAAIGGLSRDAAEDTQSGIKWLYLNAPDGGTHSSARWALNQQGLSDEELEEQLGSRSESDERDWYVIPFLRSGGITMLKIPESRFEIGDVTDGENPIEEKPPAPSVNHSAFWMSDREINVGQFEALMPELKGKPEQDGDDERTRLLKPARRLTWYDAVVYCNRLSKEAGLGRYYRLDEVKATRDGFGHIIDTNMEVAIIDQDGKGYRLPTEAEWEYACRALTTTDYNFGDDKSLLAKLTVFNAPDNEPRFCGSKIPNGWGLFDMHGNIFEWCWDKYLDDELLGEYRLLRGGSFYIYDVPEDLRSAVRSRDNPDYRDFLIGFRISRTP